MRHSAQAKVVEPKIIRATYSCDFCQKKYTRKEYLKAHIGIHTQGKLSINNFREVNRVFINS